MNIKMNKVIEIVAEYWGMSLDEVRSMTLKDFHTLCEVTLEELRRGDRQDILSPKKELKKLDI